MADGELQVAIVPDEQALENIEEKQLEIAGEPDSVGEAKELNESQDQKLGVMSRKLGRIGSRLGQVAVIVTLLAALSKILGGLFDIGFEDVRNAIVTAINELHELLKGVLKNLIPSTTSFYTRNNGGESRGPLELLAGGLGGPAGLGLFNALSSNDNNGGGGNTTNQTVNLLTSRSMLTGDSTQQEMSSQNGEDFILNGGS